VGNYPRPPGSEDADRHMKREYKIRWRQPTGYDPSAVLSNLPSPIASGFREIYNYSVDDDGFSFVDHLVDDRVAGQAFKLFVDEALSYVREIEISQV
jgi:hypothetical protein